MKYEIITKSMCLIALFAAASFSRVAIETKNSDYDLGISANVWMENGQFAFFSFIGDEKSHYWINRSFLNLGVDAVISEHVKIELGIEGKMWHNLPKGEITGQAYYKSKHNSTFIIDRACGTYFLGDSESPLFEVSFGRFVEKYNPDVKNLGEYLFRSGTYPAYLINNFDLAFARVTGIKLSGSPYSFWHNELLLTFETDIPPYNDASLTYLSDVKVGGFLTLGAGVQFAHLISVDESKTTPEESSNMYVEGTDTGYYSFRGTKLMGRVSFDPISLLRKLFSMDLAFFGTEDCKFYSEAAVLGLESYPANDSTPAGVRYTGQRNTWGYDNIAKKIPLVLGFNIPTFKVLDVLSFEAEYFGSAYPNNYLNQLGVGSSTSLPLPKFNRNYDYTKENWKWSLYAKKMFVDGKLGIVGQVARDHIRNESLVDEGVDLEESLRSSKHLWWMVKFMASF